MDGYSRQDRDDDAIDETAPMVVRMQDQLDRAFDGARAARRNANRRARNQAMRDLGLVRVRGSVSGRIYWE